MKPEADIRKLLDLYKKANRITTTNADFSENAVIGMLACEAALSWVLDVPVLDPITEDPIPNPVEHDSRGLEGYLEHLGVL